ncbi:MAG: hypothetical protein K9J21_06910 [Bacteroidales bacterium]|nr:hypothetical protein [Bacteroidales bacterium]
MGQPKIKQISGLQAALDAKALDSVVVKKANNLNDLPSKSSARSNLDVLSTSEINSLIAGANTARTVATLTDFQNLTDLIANERVHVQDDGDGKWALYLVISTTDGTYSNSTIEKIADEDIFDNAMTASAVKSAYESNANTNAYEDADKGKVDRISVNNPIDLDEVKSVADSAQADATQAISDAASAQTSADSAQTTANNAQSDANAAQATADSKEDKFTEARETFTNKTSDAGTALNLTLSNAVKSGFDVQVFINGIYALPTYTAGNSAISINPGYAIETSDDIVVIYKHANV